MGLVHLLLDDGVSGLPHDRRSSGFRDRFRQRLRRLDVENDRLSLSRPRQHVARVDDQKIIPPHDLARPVDDADAVRISVERDADVGAVLFHGRDEVFQVSGDRWIGMVVGKRAVALTEEKTRVDAEPREELWRNERARTVPAIDDDLERLAPRASLLTPGIMGKRPDSFGYVVDVSIDDLL